MSWIIIGHVWFFFSTNQQAFRRLNKSDISMILKPFLFTIAGRSFRANAVLESFILQGFMNATLSVDTFFLIR